MHNNSVAHGEPRSDAFNTPLEMLHGGSLDAEPRRNALSILHWRCSEELFQGRVTPATIAFQYSIGDAEVIRPLVEGYDIPDPFQYSIGDAATTSLVQAMSSG